MDQIRLKVSCRSAKRDTDGRVMKSGRCVAKRYGNELLKVTVGLSGRILSSLLL